MFLPFSITDKRYTSVKVKRTAAIEEMFILGKSIPRNSDNRQRWARMASPKSIQNALTFQ